MGAANILLVDDDQDCCAWLSSIFTKRGYTVDMAYDGPSALELSGQNRYRLALLDYKMPSMDGLELCRRLRDSQAGVVVALLTAFASTATIATAVDAGVRRILSKPVDFGILMPFVEEIVGPMGDRKTVRNRVLQPVADCANVPRAAISSAVRGGIAGEVRRCRACYPTNWLGLVAMTACH